MIAANSAGQLRPLLLYVLRWAVRRQMRGLTRVHFFFQQALHMDAPPEILPDVQPGGGWVEQVRDDLLVNFQAAALAQEAHLPAVLL